jgi:predicted nucleic acid-binding Zn ribbon protein
MPDLLNHQHCRVCERAIPVSEDEHTCAEHKAEYDAIQKKRRRTVLLFYVGSAVLVIVLLQQLLRPVL